MPNSYDVGDLVRISAVFKNVNLSLVDPSSVVVLINQPNGTTYSKQYGTDADVVKDSTGNYYIDYYIQQAGLYSYKFSGTGAVTASGVGSFSAS